MFAKQLRPAGKSYFEYQDADGVTVCRKVRTDPGKHFAWQHPDGAGGWKTGRGCEPLFYRLPDLLAAPEDAVVYFAEGEAKADKLAGWGLIATSSKDLPADLSLMEGRTVVILPDYDAKGADIANAVARRLEGVAGRVIMVSLPGLPDAGDIIDWTGTVEDLQTLVAAELADAALPLPTLDLAALAGVRPSAKQFAIERLAPLGEVTLFTGPGSAGKSLLGQQLATAAAGGLSCLGLAVAPCPAIYLTCEDDAGQLHWRQDHICRSLGVAMEGLAGKLHLISLRGELDNDLGTFAADGTYTPSKGYHRLVRMVLATASKLVCLDNLAHLFTGNENDRQQVTRFVNLLNRLAGETGAAILLLGHPNKSGDDYSGSTAWLNAVRSQFTIDHERTGSGDVFDLDARTVTVGKANYAQKGEAIRFRWHEWAFVLEDELPDSTRSELAQISKANGDNSLFLSCLAERTRQRRAVSEKHSATFAPTIFATMPESKRIGKKRLGDAMDRLFRIGKIERAELWKGEDRKAVFGLRETTESCGQHTVRETRETVAEMAENRAGNAGTTHSTTT